MIAGFFVIRMDAKYPTFRIILVSKSRSFNRKNDGLCFGTNNLVLRRANGVSDEVIIRTVKLSRENLGRNKGLITPAGMLSSKVAA